MVAPGIILSSPGTGNRGTLYFHSHFPIPIFPFPFPIPNSPSPSQSPVPNPRPRPSPSPSRLTIIIMSRKREKSQGPTTEETVTRLETRLREFEDRMAKKIRDLEDLVQYLTEKLTTIHGSSKEEKEGTQGKLVRLETTVAGFDECMSINKRLLEQIREKLYNFDINKKNNLIFNGVPTIPNENNDRLVASIKTIIRKKLKIIRFIDILVTKREIFGVYFIQFSLRMLIEWTQGQVF